LCSSLLCSSRVLFLNELVCCAPPCCVLHVSCSWMSCSVMLILAVFFTCLVPQWVSVLCSSLLCSSRVLFLNELVCCAPPCCVLHVSCSWMSWCVVLLLAVFMCLVPQWVGVLCSSLLCSFACPVPDVLIQEQDMRGTQQGGAQHTNSNTHAHKRNMHMY
jgi:hypothetical protein